MKKILLLLCLLIPGMAYAQRNAAHDTIVTYSKNGVRYIHLRDTVIVLGDILPNTNHGSSIGSSSIHFNKAYFDSVVSGKWKGDPPDSVNGQAALLAAKAASNHLHTGTYLLVGDSTDHATRTFTNGTYWRFADSVNYLRRDNNLAGLSNAAAARVNLGTLANADTNDVARRTFTNATYLKNADSTDHATRTFTGATYQLKDADLDDLADGTLSITAGGTGRQTGATAYGLIAAGTTATGAQQTLAAGLTTQILVGGGTGALPAWGADIPTTVTIGTQYIYRATGTDVPLTDGGTGASSAAAALTNLGATPLSRIEALSGVSMDSSAMSITGVYPMNISGGYIIDTIQVVINGANSPSITIQVSSGVSLASALTHIVTPAAITTINTVNAITGAALQNTTVDNGKIIWLTFSAANPKPWRTLVVVKGHRI